MSDFLWEDTPLPPVPIDRKRKGRLRQGKSEEVADWSIDSISRLH